MLHIDAHACARMHAGCALLAWSYTHCLTTRHTCLQAGKHKPYIRTETNKARSQEQRNSYGTGEKHAHNALNLTKNHYIGVRLCISNQYSPLSSECRSFLITDCKTVPSNLKRSPQEEKWQRQTTLVVSLIR